MFLQKTTEWLYQVIQFGLLPFPMLEILQWNHILLCPLLRHPLGRLQEIKVCLEGLCAFIYWWEVECSETSI